MKNLFTLFGLLLLLLTASCSSNKAMDDEMDGVEDESVALEDQNEYQSEDEINEDQYTENTIEQPDEQADEQAEVAQTGTEPTQEVYADTSSVNINTNGATMEYTVNKSETMMLIAFNLYGDYNKWKSIKDLNPDVDPASSLQAGSTLVVLKPSEEFAWRPEGDAYLIKKHDTLGKISFKLYETDKNWKDLYHHNQPLIKDPNIIYAGFTIYYLPDGNYNRVPAQTSN